MASELKTDPKYDDYDYPTTSPTVQSGHPGHTTPEQDAQVFQLRTQLEQAGYKDRLDTLSMVSCTASQHHRVSRADDLLSFDFCVLENSMSTMLNRCGWDFLALKPKALN